MSARTGRNVFGVGNSAQVFPSELGTVVVCTFGGSPGGDTVKTVESHAGYDLLLG